MRGFRMDLETTTRKFGDLVERAANVLRALAAQSPLQRGGAGALFGDGKA
ncbi:hypothetical protein HMPREF9004_0603 [Schaalia cardiffensis F0333]|uniref:Uncharacterized protein n=1 Tax=Schaalia cardiffensis F0333 TaxID=888050 RepID=N6WE78_9ACTO|nr:hypothetical protein HMPREF9004_0603 [Schaalia cardiffensis F0333]